MKKILLIISIFCMFSLSSCGVFKELKEGLDDAIITAEDFCQALADDDIESAKGFLHPDSTPKESELLSFIIKLEEVNDIDFSLGELLKHEQIFQVLSMIVLMAVVFIN
jgi:hypothetical protein